MIKRYFEAKTAKTKSSILAKILAGIILVIGFSFAFAGPAGAQEAQDIMPRFLRPAPGANIATPRPAITGIAEQGDVLVYIDEVFNGVAQAKNGKFSYFPFLPLASGPHKVKILTKAGQAELNFNIIPNPAPTLLAPAEPQTGFAARLGQDRIWAGGVARNDSRILIFIDGKEKTRVSARNHASGTGSFRAELSGLPLGEHQITAIARDRDGKDSFVSRSLTIAVLPPTPAPTVFQAVVDSAPGIAQPLITGLAKNGLEVSIVIDDKIVAALSPAPGPGGTASFAWHPEANLILGNHKIEAFASDQGKLSNNSKAIYWQAGKPAAAGQQNQKQAETGKVPAAGPAAQEEEPLGVAPAAGDEKEIKVLSGRVRADDEDDDEDKLAQQRSAATEGVEELSPNAVVKTQDEAADNQGKRQTKSLAIGLLILALLILSVAVWYIQERRAPRPRPPETIADLFGESEEKEKQPLKKEENTDENPPPPPPMF